MNLILNAIQFVGVLIAFVILGSLGGCLFDVATHVAALAQ